MLRSGLLHGARAPSAPAILHPPAAPRIGRYLYQVHANPRLPAPLAARPRRRMQQGPVADTADLSPAHAVAQGHPHQVPSQPRERHTRRVLPITRTRAEEDGARPARRHCSSAKPIASPNRRLASKVSPYFRWAAEMCVLASSSWSRSRHRFLA